MKYRAVNNEVRDSNGTTVCVCPMDNQVQVPRPMQPYYNKPPNSGVHILDGCGLAERIAKLLNDAERRTDD